MPDSSRNAIKVLLGIDLPTADPARMRAAAEIFDGLSDRLSNELTDVMNSVRSRVRRNFGGEATHFYDRSLAAFTSGERDYVGKAAGSGRELSNQLRSSAANVEYMAAMVWVQLAQLLAEIAWAVAMSKFTFGASLTWISVFRAIRSLAIRRLLVWLLTTVPSHQIISHIFASFGALIQRVQIAKGTRAEFDQKLSNDAHIGATVEGFVSAGLSLGAGAFLNNNFAKVFTGHIDTLRTLPGPTPTSTLNRDLADILTRNQDEMLVPFNPNSPPGARAWDNADAHAGFRDDVADVFQRNFGERIGPDQAKRLGEDYANTLVRSWGDPDVASRLAQTIGDRVPPNTRGLLADIPQSLLTALHQNMAGLSPYLRGLLLGSTTGAAEGVLGEGLGNAATGNGFVVTPWSATSGATMNAAHQVTTDSIVTGINMLGPNGTIPPPDLPTPPAPAPGPTDVPDGDSRVPDPGPPGEARPPGASTGAGGQRDGSPDSLRIAIDLPRQQGGGPDPDRGETASKVPQYAPDSANGVPPPSASDHAPGPDIERPGLERPGTGTASDLPRRSTADDGTGVAPPHTPSGVHDRLDGHGDTPDTTPTSETEQGGPSPDGAVSSPPQPGLSTPGAHVPQGRDGAAASGAQDDRPARTSSGQERHKESASSEGSQERSPESDRDVPPAEPGPVASPPETAQSSPVPSFDGQLNPSGNTEPVRTSSDRDDSSFGSDDDRSLTEDFSDVSSDGSSLFDRDDTASVVTEASEIEAVVAAQDLFTPAAEAQSDDKPYNPLSGAPGKDDPWGAHNAIFAQDLMVFPMFDAGSGNSSSSPGRAPGPSGSPDGTGPNPHSGDGGAPPSSTGPAELRAEEAHRHVPELLDSLEIRDIARAWAVGRDIQHLLTPRPEDEAAQDPSVRAARERVLAVMYTISDPRDRQLPLPSADIPAKRIDDALLLARGIGHNLNERHLPLNMRIRLPHGRPDLNLIARTMYSPPTGSGATGTGQSATGTNTSGHVNVTATVDPDARFPQDLQINTMSVEAEPGAQKPPTTGSTAHVVATESGSHTDLPGRPETVESPEETVVDTPGRETTEPSNRARAAREATPDSLVAGLAELTGMVVERETARQSVLKADTARDHAEEAAQVAANAAAAADRASSTATDEVRRRAEDARSLAERAKAEHQDAHTVAAEANNRYDALVQTVDRAAASLVERALDQAAQARVLANTALKAADDARADAQSAVSTASGALARAREAIASGDGNTTVAQVLNAVQVAETARTAREKAREQAVLVDQEIHKVSDALAKADQAADLSSPGSPARGRLSTIGATERDTDGLGREAAEVSAEAGTAHDAVRGTADRALRLSLNTARSHARTAQEAVNRIVPRGLNSVHRDFLNLRTQADAAVRTTESALVQVGTASNALLARPAVQEAAKGAERAKSLAQEASSRYDEARTAVETAYTRAQEAAEAAQAAQAVAERARLIADGAPANTTAADVASRVHEVATKAQDHADSAHRYTDTAQTEKALDRVGRIMREIQARAEQAEAAHKKAEKPHKILGELTREETTDAFALDYLIESRFLTPDRLFTDHVPTMVKELITAQAPDIPASLHAQVHQEMVRVAHERGEIAFFSSDGVPITVREGTGQAARTWEVRVALGADEPDGYRHLPLPHRESGAPWESRMEERSYSTTQSGSLSHDPRRGGSAGFTVSPFYLGAGPGDSAIGAWLQVAGTYATGQRSSTSGGTEKASSSTLQSSFSPPETYLNDLRVRVWVAPASDQVSDSPSVTGDTTPRTVRSGVISNGMVLVLPGKVNTRPESVPESIDLAHGSSGAGTAGTNTPARLIHEPTHGIPIRVNAVVPRGEDDHPGGHRDLGSWMADYLVSETYVPHRYANSGLLENTFRKKVDESIQHWQEVVRDFFNNDSIQEYLAHVDTGPISLSIPHPTLGHVMVELSSTPLRYTAKKHTPNFDSTALRHITESNTLLSRMRNKSYSMALGAGFGARISVPGGGSARLNMPTVTYTWRQTLSSLASTFSRGSEHRSLTRFVSDTEEFTAFDVERTLSVRFLGENTPHTFDTRSVEILPGESVTYLQSVAQGEDPLTGSVGEQDRVQPFPHLRGDRITNFSGTHHHSLTWAPRPDSAQPPADGEGASPPLSPRDQSVLEALSARVLTSIAQEHPGLVIPELSRNWGTYAARPGAENLSYFKQTFRERWGFRRSYPVAYENTMDILQAIRKAMDGNNREKLASPEGLRIPLREPASIDPTLMSRHEVFRPDILTLALKADFSALEYKKPSNAQTGLYMGGTTTAASESRSGWSHAFTLLAGTGLIHSEEGDADGLARYWGSLMASLGYTRSHTRAGTYDVTHKTYEWFASVGGSERWMGEVGFTARLYQDDANILSGDTDRGVDLLKVPIKAVYLLNTPKSVTEIFHRGRSDEVVATSELTPGEARAQINPRPETDDPQRARTLLDQGATIAKIDLTLVGPDQTSTTFDLTPEEARALIDPPPEDLPTPRPETDDPQRARTLLDQGATIAKIDLTLVGPDQTSTTFDLTPEEARALIDPPPEAEDRRRARAVVTEGATIEKVDPTLAGPDQTSTGTLLQRTLGAFTDKRRFWLDGRMSKLRSYLDTLGGRRFFAGFLSATALANNPATFSPSGHRARFELKGRLLSPNDLRTMVAIFARPEKITGLSQHMAPWAITGETSSSAGSTTAKAHIVNAGVRASAGGTTNPVEQDKDANPATRSSAPGPAPLIGPNHQQTLYHREKRAESGVVASSELFLMTRATPTYFVNVAGTISQALEFKKQRGLNLFPRWTHKYVGWKAPVSDLFSGHIRARDAEQGRIIDDAVILRNGRPIRSTQRNPESPAGVEVRAGFDGAGLQRRPADSTAVVAELIRELHGEGLALTQDGEKDLRAALDEQGGKNTAALPPVLVNVVPTRGAPLSTPARVHIQLQKTNPRVDYVSAGDLFLETHSWKAKKKKIHSQGSGHSTGVGFNPLQPPPTSSSADNANNGPENQEKSSLTFVTPSGSATATRRDTQETSFAEEHTDTIVMGSSGPYLRFTHDTSLTLTIEFKDHEPVTASADGGPVHTFHLASSVDFDPPASAAHSFETIPSAPTVSPGAGDTLSAAMTSVIREEHGVPDPALSHAIIMPTAIRYEGQDLRDLVVHTAAHSLGWKPEPAPPTDESSPDQLKRLREHHADNTRRAREYLASHLKLDDRYTPIENNLDPSSIKGLFSHVSGHPEGTEILDIGGTQWRVAATPDFTNARISTGRPDARLAHNKSVVKSASHKSSHGSGATLEGGPAPAGTHHMEHDDPNRSALMTGGAQATLGAVSDTSGTAREIADSGPPLMERQRLGTAYLVEFDTHWTAGSRSPTKFFDNLKGSVRQRVGTGTGEARTPRTDAGGTEHQDARESDEASVQHIGTSTGKVSAWISRTDAINLGILTQEQADSADPHITAEHDAAKAMETAEATYNAERAKLPALTEAYVNADATRTEDPQKFNKARDAYNAQYDVYQKALAAYEEAMRTWRSKAIDTQTHFREQRPSAPTAGQQPPPTSSEGPFGPHLADRLEANLGSRPPTELEKNFQSVLNPGSSSPPHPTGSRESGDAREHGVSSGVRDKGKGKAVPSRAEDAAGPSEAANDQGQARAAQVPHIRFSQDPIIHHMTESPESTAQASASDDPGGMSDETMAGFVAEMGLEDHHDTPSLPPGVTPTSDTPGSPPQVNKGDKQEHPGNRNKEATEGNSESKSEPSPPPDTKDYTSFAERNGLDTLDGRFKESSMPLPTLDPKKILDSTREGRILGLIPTEKIARYKNGEIEKIWVNGEEKLLEEWQRDLTTSRTEEINEYRQKHVSKRGNTKGQPLISQISMGKKMGAVNAIVIDKINGVVAEGMNGQRFSILEPMGPSDTNPAPNKMHPKLQVRIDEMTITKERAVRENIEQYQLYSEAHEPTPEEEGGLSATPHPDHPGRHAEIKASSAILHIIDELTKENSKRFKKTDIKHFHADTRFTFKQGMDSLKCPFCANCNTILHDAPDPPAGRMSHDKNDPRLVSPKYREDLLPPEYRSQYNHKNQGD